MTESQIRPAPEPCNNAAQQARRVEAPGDAPNLDRFAHGAKVARLKLRGIALRPPKVGWPVRDNDGALPVERRRDHAVVRRVAPPLRVVDHVLAVGKAPHGHRPRSFHAGRMTRQPHAERGPLDHGRKRSGQIHACAGFARCARLKRLASRESLLSVVTIPTCAFNAEQSRFTSTQRTPPLSLFSAMNASTSPGR